MEREIEMSEGEREKKEKRTPLFFWFCGVWQRVQQRQQDQSFKCSSVLAALCVSALGGSTKFCHPTQHSDSDKKKRKKKAKDKINKQQSPSHLIYPTSAHIPHTLSILMSPYCCTLSLLPGSHYNIQQTTTHETTVAIFA